MPYTVTLSGQNSHTIQPLKTDFTSYLAAGLSSILFILLSLSLIPYAGIQEDEALFSIPLYQPAAREFRVRMFHHTFPIMVMTYVGTLKTLLYRPLIQWFGSSLWTVRLPVVLVGGATVFVFYHLTRDVLTPSRGATHAALAALAAALLLATDPVFLLTNTFDWGPVALEHALLVTGCFLVFRFATDQSQIRFLAAGFGCFGLAMWNKALFGWALSGLTAGALTVFWTEVKQCLTWRNVKVAGGAFLAGALPFVIYNIHASSATVRENAHLETDRMPAKWLQLERAADGSSLFGYMTSEDSDRPLKLPPTWRGRLAQWIYQRVGERRETGFFYVFGGMLALAPIWWRVRAARFSLVFLVVAWSMMALTKNAGASAHHDILLWPFPLLFAACVLACIPWRWVAGLAAAAMLLMNLLVVNQYILQFERAGATGGFTDATIALNRLLPEDQTIYVTDWGMNATLQLTHQGRLHLFSAQAALMGDAPNPDQEAQLRTMLADTNAIWLGHVTGREAFEGVNAHLEQFASKAGYQRELLRTVTDSNGRPVYEIFRFRPSA